MSSTIRRPAFQQLQYRFSAHIRNPQQVPAPANIEDRRMQIYRELFYNNLEGFVANAFPVLRSLMADGPWHAMVRDFFAQHYCQTPYFLEIAQEFLVYLQNERVAGLDDLPFALELAHYEWLELAMDVDVSQVPDSGFNPDGNLLHGRPVLSPLVNVACYHYPVHRIGVDFIPEQPPSEATYLVVYRNLQDEVRFMEINAVTARLLILLQEQPGLTGMAVMEQIQQELQHPRPGVVMQGGLQALEHMRDVGIVLGTELKPL